MRRAFLASCLLLGVGSLVVARGGSIVGSGDNAPGAGNFSCPVASITDGDTLRCTDGTRVRLSGIAARERDGSCSPGHPCPDASAEAASIMLGRLAIGQVLDCQAEGVTYGRIAAFCRVRATGEDLSCAMVASGAAAKWARYWRGHSCAG